MDGMTQPATPEDAVTQAALNPQSARLRDGQSATSHPIPDLIKAAEFAAAQEAAQQSHLGLRFIKLIPPGCG